MESGVAVVESSVSRSEPVGEKRPGAEDLDGSPLKKSRGGSQQRLVGDVKKVSEMVLVLAAMGKMRGGKGPSNAEKELMEEARNRLAKVCEGFAPKDVFPRDAFGGVIEDLGLNKLKEQRLGFRPPKMSIAEKLLVSKRKMEKADDLSLHSTPQSSRLHPNSGTAVESRNASHPVQIPQPDKSSHMPLSSGSFQPATPLPHSSSVNSTPLPYQLPTSEVRPVVSGALSSSHLSAGLSRVDRPHIRSDGRPNGSSYPSQVQANYSANSTVRVPTWSVKPQSALTSKTGSDSKVPVNMPLKVDRAAGVKSGLAPQTTKTVVSQAIGGPPSQVSNHVQSPPSGNVHAEIGKIVQKLLHRRVPERPTWIPPSRDYMSKALTCQICMLTVTEIDSILICDACEKGYHLKCLQTTNPKGVPRGEWHCGNCLSLTNGKPLPPKYGRVMRNINTPKISLSSNSAGIPSTSSHVIGSSEKVGQPKAMVNGNTIMENSRSGGLGNNYGQQTYGSERIESKLLLEKDNASVSSKVDDKVSSGTHLDDLITTSSSASVSSLNSFAGKSSVGKVTELKSNSTSEPVMVLSSSDKPQAVANALEAIPSKQPFVNNLLLMESKESHGDVFRESNESHGDECSNNYNQLKEEEVICDNPSRVVASAGAMNLGRSSDGLHFVKWVGDPVQTLDEKVYYSSCCVNGHLCKAMDHVLIRFDNGRLIPSKLQVMWEDKSTMMQWVMVNLCYFPGDLPEAVGRPCGLESSEVYESTFGRALMAGLIEGPCEVLPPRRFAEEIERRNRLGKQNNDNLPPLYLCKWIYDEAKGLFRDISC